MALDTKGIISDGFWPTDYNYLNALVITDGYATEIEYSIIVTVLAYVFVGETPNAYPIYKSDSTYYGVAIKNPPEPTPLYKAEEDKLHLRLFEKTSEAEDWRNANPRRWEKVTING